MRKTIALAAVAAIASCSTNPFVDPATIPSGSVATLPGTDKPKATKALVRMEPTQQQGGGDAGDGYAQDVSFDPATNTFTIDNLAFDGENTYRLPATQPGGGALPYSVYESADIVRDPVTGAPINQLTHRLLAGVSKTGRTEFAIVRTGDYIPYGFGGFVLKRNDAVTLPTSGQATYNGDYAGLRDFSGKSGLEYASGKMTLDIDFNDFNAGDAVKGTIYDRQIFDLDGNNITRRVLDAMDAKYDDLNKVPPSSALPVLSFRIGPGAIDKNGELNGALDSQVIDYRGERPAVAEFETGKYYAMVSGAGADEVVGIVVVTSADPRVDGVVTRETGGFILYRP
jgi:hypothetical protein